MTHQAAPPLNAPRAQAARHLRAIERAMGVHALTARAVAILLGAWLTILLAVRLPHAVHAHTGSAALAVTLLVAPATLVVGLAIAVEYAAWLPLRHIVPFRALVPSVVDARRRRDELRAYLRDTSPERPGAAAVEAH